MQKSVGLLGSMIETEKDTMNQYRFFDIVAENNEIEYSVDKEYILYIPTHSMDTALDRQEFIASMLDMLVAASGLNIVSFRDELLVNQP